MASRRIRVSSSALGESCEVEVRVYDTVDEMQAAGTRYNGNDHDDSAAMVQARVDESGRTVSVIVRLHRERLGTRIVCHEIHHAATALYGAYVGDRISRAAHLNHHNEPFAYLYSDLLGGLIGRLYALGYYDGQVA